MTNKIYACPFRLNDLLVMSDGLSYPFVLHAGISVLSNFELALVERLSLNLPIGFKSSNDVLTLPASLGLNWLDLCQEKV